MGAVTAATTTDSAAGMVKTGETRAAMTIPEACRLIVDLLRQLSAARGELAAARAERDAYREMVCVALKQLHEKGCELNRMRASRYRLIEEFRALRKRRRTAAA